MLQDGFGGREGQSPVGEIITVVYFVGTGRFNPFWVVLEGNFGIFPQLSVFRGTLMSFCNTQEIKSFLELCFTRTEVVPNL